MNENINSFDGLNPEIFIDAVEESLGTRMTGFAAPLTSYINRVYELQAVNGKRFIAKFYRPGRWSKEALIDEHNFILDCEEVEIPVIAPIVLKNGKTLGEINGIYFAVFTKKLGRFFEVCSDVDWKRLGSILGRLHIVGARRKAVARIKHHPMTSTLEEINFLKDGMFISSRYMQEFNSLTNDILDTIGDLLENIEYIRTHGDCHCGNLLHRPGEGIMLIDFDDMMTAPPVQDMWLLLPDHACNSKKELKLITEGYAQFREFDFSSVKLIEPLRIMRLLYFLAWCAKQEKDLKFQSNFPNWGTDSFWRQETSDLRNQLDIIKQDI